MSTAWFQGAADGDHTNVLLVMRSEGGLHRLVRFFLDVSCAENISQRYMANVSNTEIRGVTGE